MSLKHIFVAPQKTNYNGSISYLCIKSKIYFFRNTPEKQFPSLFKTDLGAVCKQVCIDGSLLPNNIFLLSKTTQDPRNTKLVQIFPDFPLAEAMYRKFSNERPVLICSSKLWQFWSSPVKIMSLFRIKMLNTRGFLGVPHPRTPAIFSRWAMATKLVLFKWANVSDLDSLWAGNPRAVG